MLKKNIKMLYVELSMLKKWISTLVPNSNNTYLGDDLFQKSVFYSANVGNVEYDGSLQPPISYFYVFCDSHRDNCTWW